mgnify:CR=1 FL=1
MCPAKAGSASRVGAVPGIQIGHAGRKGATKLAWDGIDKPLLPGDRRWRRLDTAWRQANPAHMGRTTVGDTVSCGGELAPTVRFAGVQMNPDFGQLPVPHRHGFPTAHPRTQPRQLPCRPGGTPHPLQTGENHHRRGRR